MNGVTSIEDGERYSLAAHALGSAVLRELHARPFTSIPVSRRLPHFAFDTSEGRAQIDRANLAEFCKKQRVALPLPEEKYHRVTLGTTALPWDQHSEFTSMRRETWKAFAGQL
ncbi:DUF3422 family protein [Bradyrhizobium sp. 5.13L]